MNDNKEGSGIFMALFFLFYFLPSIIMFIIGIIEANNIVLTSCNKSMTRLEYIYPAYRVGCYLNKRVANE